MIGVFKPVCFIIIFYKDHFGWIGVWGEQVWKQVSELEGSYSRPGKMVILMVILTGRYSGDKDMWKI